VPLFIARTVMNEWFFQKAVNFFVTSGNIIVLGNLLHRFGEVDMIMKAELCKLI
jgi:Holliday junction resolvase-like predicted endonuclease